MTYAGDLTPAQAWEVLESNPQAILVDVRTDGEWRAHGVPDTSSLGRTPLFVEWVSNTGTVNPDFVQQVREQAGADQQAPILLLCRSGVRSVAAANALTNAGLGPAYNILEGFEGVPDANGERTVNGWRNSDLPSTTL